MLVRRSYWLFLFSSATSASSSRIWGSPLRPGTLWSMRGGDSAPPQETEELSLDEKVHAAMKKLGLTLPGDEGDDACEGGVCSMPETPAASKTNETSLQENPRVLAGRIAKEMQVDEALAMAAIGATSIMEGGTQRRYDEAAAREMIQQELSWIEQVSDDCDEVKQLVSEGHDSFLSRRALAFAEMNVEDARAILLADQMDEKAEAEEARKMQAEKVAPSPLKTVTVNADFDPAAEMAAPRQQQQQQPPKLAKKEDVVFDATAADLQALVLESPVPVLLDVYADWCGPCKTLTPILEEMALKAGGMFRLVKVNSDNERAVSGALEVTALPTVFGFKDGKIVHMFQGMPRGEEGMKNFMMGLLMPGASFNPPVSADERKKYAALSSKLAKTAGAAGFSFSARERLQDRMVTRLDQLVVSCDGNMADAEDTAKVIRSLLSNVIRDPFDVKYRRVNLQNKVLATKVAAFPPCISILKSVGFVPESDGNAMTLGKDKKVVNVAPVTVARDCIDKWIDKNRQKIAAASRKRRDDIERQRLAEEAAAASDDEEEHEEKKEEVDPDAVSIKLRLEGKKKVNDLALRADDPLSLILDRLPEKAEDDEDIQLTCVAKRLVVKSSDEVAMSKSLREHGLVPTASIVVKIGNGSGPESSTALKERAAAQKNRKKGSHTMQSVGIYGKDDNAKGELVDGGGGVLYEQDVSDDEEETVDANQQSEGKDDEQEEQIASEED